MAPRATIVTRVPKRRPRILHGFDLLEREIKRAARRDEQHSPVGDDQHAVVAGGYAGRHVEDLLVAAHAPDDAVEQRACLGHASAIGVGIGELLLGGVALLRVVHRPIMDLLGVSQDALRLENRVAIGAARITNRLGGRFERVCATWRVGAHLPVRLRRAPSRGNCA